MWASRSAAAGSMLTRRLTGLLGIDVVDLLRPRGRLYLLRVLLRRSMANARRRQAAEAHDGGQQRADGPRRLDLETAPHLVNGDWLALQLIEKTHSARSCKTAYLDGRAREGDSLTSLTRPAEADEGPRRVGRHCP